MKKRKPKKSDQSEVERAFNLLKETMRTNSDIEPTLWAGALWSVLVDGYINSGFSYEYFYEEWDRTRVHYKSWWDDDR